MHKPWAIASLVSTLGLPAGLLPSKRLSLECFLPFPLPLPLVPSAAADVAKPGGVDPFKLRLMASLGDTRC